MRPKNFQLQKNCGPKRDISQENFVQKINFGLHESGLKKRWGGVAGWMRCKIRLSSDNLGQGWGRRLVELGNAPWVGAWA